MDRTEFTCPVCSDLLYEPVCLPCAHMVCHDHLQSMEDEKCPLCREEFPDNLKVSKHFQKIIETLFPQECEKRRNEVEESIRIQKEVDRYYHSERKKFLATSINNFVKKTAIASYEELETGCGGRLMNEYHTSLLTDEIKICVFEDKGKNVYPLKWGVIGSGIYTELWMNYVVSFFSRQRYLRDPTLTLIDDRKTSLKILPSFEFSQEEKSVLSEIVCMRESNIAAFQIGPNSRQDILSHIRLNIKDIGSAEKTREVIYTKINGFVDIAIPSSNTQPQSGPVLENIPESQSRLPNTIYINGEPVNVTMTTSNYNPLTQSFTRDSTTSNLNQLFATQLMGILSSIASDPETIYTIEGGVTDNDSTADDDMS